MPGNLVHDLTVVAIEWRPCGPMDSLQRSPASPAEFRARWITRTTTWTESLDRSWCGPRDFGAAQRRAAAATEFRARGLLDAAARTANLSHRRPGTGSALRPGQTLRRDPLLGRGAGSDGLKGSVAATTAKFRARREASATFRASDDAGRGQSYPGNTAEAAALRGR